MADTDMWEAERERFEAEIRKVNDDPAMLERWPGGAYKHHGVDGRWGGWKMACLASRPAELVDERLLALPAPEVLNFGVRGYTAEQYRQGQLDAREYQRKVDGKIIARRNETIADLRFNIGELMKVVAPSHDINKDGN